MMWRLREYGCWFVVLLMVAQTLWGCTVAPSPRGMNAVLVSEDDPIFDKSFEELSFEDIDLKQMWVEREISEERDNVVIHNNTFADVVERVKGGEIGRASCRERV